MGLVKPLPYGRQSIDDDDVAAVTAVLRGDWLTQGPTVAEFERALAEITGARYVVAVSNGTAALHLAALAAGVNPGDAAITSTITFVASANCVRYAGGTPFFADVDPRTALVSLPSLEEHVDRLVRAGRPPKAIVPVDMTGSVPDLPRVQEIAKRAGAVVIEDAAHALGSTYRHDGTTYRAGGCAHATLAILSFHPVKHLTTGEGGAITTNDKALYDELLELRSHGITREPSRLERNDGPWYYEQRALGFNYRITDLQCALGLSQAKKLPRFVARRRALASLYDRAFTDLAEHLTPLSVPAGVDSAYHLYVVRLRARPGENQGSVAERRKALFSGLRERQIFPQVHYIPVHTQPDFRRAGLGSGSFPGAEEYYAGCLSLPMFPAMEDDDVERVVAALSELVVR